MVHGQSAPLRVSKEHPACSSSALAVPTTGSQCHASGTSGHLCDAGAAPDLLPSISQPTCSLLWHASQLALNARSTGGGQRRSRVILCPQATATAHGAHRDSTVRSGAGGVLQATSQRKNVVDALQVGGCQGGVCLLEGITDGQEAGVAAAPCSKDGGKGGAAPAGGHGGRG